MVRCSYQSPFCKSKKPPAAVTITQQRAAATATAVAAEGRGVQAPVQVFPGVGPAGAAPACGWRGGSQAGSRPSRKPPPNVCRRPQHSSATAGTPNHHSNQPTSQTPTGSSR